MNPYGQEYTNRQVNRSSLRKFARRLYLRHVQKYVSGATVDFGCGTGEMLRRLPAGSVGLEINAISVAYCRTRGLPAYLYDPEKDDYALSMLIPGVYQTFVMLHVLEHLDRANDVLARILSSCNWLGIKRAIIVVPGEKGFAFDRTHRTFIDGKYIIDHNLETIGVYGISKMKYFPFNSSRIGRYITHNELVIIYDAIPKC